MSSASPRLMRVALGLSGNVEGGLAARDVVGEAATGSGAANEAPPAGASYGSRPRTRGNEDQGAALDVSRRTV